MQFAKVTIEVRSQWGKGGARKVRASGRVPGILYGHKQEPVSVTLDEKELLSSLDKNKRRNTVFSLTVSDGARSEEVVAMIRDAQIHPISRRLVHVDFLRIAPDEEITVTVPLVLTGKAVGVTNGGNLHQSAHNLPIAAKADAIPARLEIDVSALDIGDALHVSDLALPPGIRVLLDAREALASVVAPKAEKTEAEALPVEGVVPVEGAPATAEAGAAGAAPAAGEGAPAKAAPGKKDAGKKDAEKKGK